MMFLRMAFTTRSATARTLCYVTPRICARVTTVRTHVRSYAEKTVKVPQMAESISEGTLRQLAKNVGERVEQDEEIAIIETDKIDVAVNAPAAGIIKNVLAKEEDTVTVGQELFRIELANSSSVGDAHEPTVDHMVNTAPQNEQSDPAPRRMIAEKVSEMQSSEYGEDTKQREQTLRAKNAESSSRESLQTVPCPESLPARFGREERRIKMNRMRLRISERLKQSQNTAASLTTFNEVDMSNVMDFRKLYKDDILKNMRIKLGFMGMFSKAATLAMRALPAINASVEGAGVGDTIVYRDYVDISIAVATEKGLVTPVVRHAESMDLMSIERAVANLGEKARAGKLSIEDMTGGTFTISNGGVFGSLLGTPIINLPQSAVLGLHAVKDRPVAINGRVEIRPMMYLALTYDHRLLDGREAVRFLIMVKNYIEDPRRMLIEN